MSKEKKKRNKKKEPTIEMCCSEAFGEELDDATSLECYNCCCFDCGELDLAEFNGKINFSLESLCCEFSSDCSKNEKIPRRKEKSKKKIRAIKSPIRAELSESICQQFAGRTEKPVQCKTTEKSSIPMPAKNFNSETISDTIKHSSRSLSTSDLPSAFKGSSSLRLKKPRNKTSTKLCNSLRVETTTPQFRNLCSRIKSSSLSNLIPMSQTDAVKGLLNLSEHDRRILDRMSMKNLKELAQVEQAIQARKFWEGEKIERNKVRNEEQRKYLEMVHEKRRQEYLELLRRKKLIEEREKKYCVKIQNDIEARTLKAENLLRNIEMEREMLECRRKQRDLQKIEQIHTNCAESQLDDQIRREQLNERLEEKIHKAESIRVKNMDSHRIRVQTDNQIHQQIHAQKYDQTMREEILKREMLRQKMNERESKFQKFHKQKEKVLESSKTQAKTSALLRELVRRSFGPFKVPPIDSNSRGNENGRFSTCSYTSHVSHIHLN